MTLYGKTMTAVTIFVFLSNGLVLCQEEAAQNIISCIQSNADFGVSVCLSADVNGDGLSDLLVGAPYYKSAAGQSGAVFAYYGSKSGLGAVPDWSMYGTQEGEAFGWIVTSGGDLNGDGYDEILVGSPDFSGAFAHEGRLCIYYGSPTGLSPVCETELVGGQDAAGFGRSADSAGDFNGDGFSDILVGAPFASGPSGKTGSASVFYGRPSGLSTTHVLRIWGEQPGALFGWSVAGAGDINGDGISDAIVGAPHYSQEPDNSVLESLNLDFELPTHTDTREGRCYAYAGSHGNPAEAKPVWTTDGASAECTWGSYVTRAGDVNGDGFSDVAVCGRRGPTGSDREGYVAVFHGSTVGLSKNASWSQRGLHPWCSFSRYHAIPVGDIDGDHYDDLLVTYPIADHSTLDSGRCELFRGGEAGLHPQPAWRVIGNHENDWLGYAAAGGGDINGDRVPDLAITSANISGIEDGGEISVFTSLQSVGDLLPTPLTSEFAGREPPPTPNIQSLNAGHERVANRLSEAVLHYGLAIPKLMRDAEETLRYKTVCGAFRDLTHCLERMAQPRLLQIGNEVGIRLAKKYIRFADETQRTHAYTTWAQLSWGTCDALERQGRAGAARHQLDIMGTTVDDAWTQGALRDEWMQSHDVWFLFNVERRLLSPLYRTGDFDAFETGLIDLLAKANEAAQRQPENSNYPTKLQTFRLIHRDLAAYKAFVENYEEAVSFQEESLNEAGMGYLLCEDSNARATLADYLARRDGPKEEHLTMAREAVAELRKDGEIRWAISAENRLADVLNLSGKNADAIAISDRLIQECRDLGWPLVRSDAHLSRARSLLALGRASEAQQECIEALTLRRGMGIKHTEPEIYELYAIALAADGKDEQAIQIWNYAYLLCRNMNMQFRALHMLIGLVEFHQDRGNCLAVQRVWERAEALMEEYPDMPRRTLERARMVRQSVRSFLAACSNRQQNQAAESDPNAVVTPAPEDPAASDPQLAHDTNSGDSGSARSDTLVMEPIFSPITMLSGVRTNENARARFLIYNPYTSQLSGDISFSGAIASHLAQSNNTYKVDIEFGKEYRESLIPVTIPSGEALTLLLQAVITGTNENYSAQLQWNGGDTAANWEVEVSEDTKDTAVANLSDDITNPFFYTTFYHEIHYRGQTDVIRNLRAKSSIPCRIEFVSSWDFSILAIDDNGDGDFDDRGDVLNVDRDKDGYPDFFFSSDHDANAVDLLIYPGSQDLKGAKEMTIDLYLDSPDGWTFQGSDILLIE